MVPETATLFFQVHCPAALTAFPADLAADLILDQFDLPSMSKLLMGSLG